MGLVTGELQVPIKYFLYDHFDGYCEDNEQTRIRTDLFFNHQHLLFDKNKCFTSKKKNNHLNN